MEGNYLEGMYELFLIFRELRMICCSNFKVKYKLLVFNL